MPCGAEKAPTITLTARCVESAWFRQRHGRERWSQRTLADQITTSWPGQMAGALPPCRQSRKSRLLAESGLSSSFGAPFGSFLGRSPHLRLQERVSRQRLLLMAVVALSMSALGASKLGRLPVASGQAPSSAHQAPSGAHPAPSAATPGDGAAVDRTAIKRPCRP